MLQPQAGIIPDPSPTALFLILRVREPARSSGTVAQVAEEQGQEFEIVRHSFPYGTVSETSLFFVDSPRTLDIPEKMLSRMMGTSGDGFHDHLMDYTRAVSGATFFTPSLEVLNALGSR